VALRKLSCLVPLILELGCGRVGYEAVVCADALDPNDAATSAAEVELGATVAGLVVCEGQEDWLSVDLDSGEEITITTSYDAANAYLELEGWEPGAPEPRAIGTAGEDGASLRLIAARSGPQLVRIRGVGRGGRVDYDVTTEVLAGPHLFMSPSGDDGGDGSFASPLLTFATAIARLTPGTTLVLGDGRYDPVQSGRLDANCGTAAASSGTPDAPVRVVALNEHRALVTTDGVGPPIYLRDCDDWTIEGLHAENLDLPMGNGGQAVYVKGGQRIVLRRILAAHNNRFTNTGLYDLDATQDALVDECEGYFFHRMGLQVQVGATGRVRRTYLNDRNYADILMGDPIYPTGTAPTDGYLSSLPSGADFAFRIVESTDAVVESSIAEGGSVGFATAPNAVTAMTASYFGNIAIGNEYGFETNGIQGGVVETSSFEDNVAIDCGTGLQIFVGTVSVTGFTSVGATDVGIHLWSGADALTCVGCLAVNGATGFDLSPSDTWSVSSSNAFGNATNYLQAGDARLVDATEIDPELGSCRAFLPPTSPMVGAGPGGTDVGGNVVYSYIDGRRTTVPLWSPLSSRFPCGIVVPGVNDDPADGCLGSHSRAGVGPDCPLPWP